MAQPVQQVGLRAPGFQGLNTELSPINGDPEFALVADNVVVDQIGRLVSRNAFADYKTIGEVDDIYIKKPVTTSSGFSADSAIEISDNTFRLEETVEGKELWQGPSDMSIQIDAMDTYVNAQFDPSVTTFSLALECSGWRDETVWFPAGGPENPPTNIGTIEIMQNNVVLETWNLDGTIRRSERDTEATPPPSPWPRAIEHRFLFLSTSSATQHQAIITTTDATAPIVMRFTPHPEMINFYPSGGPIISVVAMEINGISSSGRGFNEIIKLGQKIVDHVNVHEQHDQRVVMAYRFGDGFNYPIRSKAIPTGMGKRRLATRMVPELTGTLGYATAELRNGELEELFLPGGWGGTNQEALLTAQFVNFKDDLFLFAKGESFLRLAATDVWETVTTNIPINGDIAISAYGRLWVSGVGGDYHTIYYSTLLDEEKWYDPTATDFNDGGVIDVREYWPVDGDSIVNIHAHNGYLLVFGRNSILIYANADSGSPAGILNQQDSGIFLEDTISNVGLVRRDAICNIGTDVLFVDDSGLRSIGRVIQEKSNPLQEPSINIRRELQQVIQQEITDTEGYSAIKLSYLPSQSMAVLLFAELQIAYVFHLNMPSKTGGMKVTRWTDCFWNDAVEVKEAQEDIVYLGGKPSKGLLRYEGYLEGSLSGTPEPYVMRYESMALAMGQSPMQTFIPKSIHYVCMGEFIPGQANALWGFSDRMLGNREFQIDIDGGAQFDVDEFANDSYYLDGGPFYKGYKINTTGSGELFRVGLEVKVQGGKYGLQEIDINSAIGRLTA